MKKERVEILKMVNGKISRTEDVAATEVRFEVKTWGRESFWISCTPENLEELVIGLLFSNGCIDCAEQVERVEVSFEKSEIHAVLGEKRSVKRAAGKSCATLDTAELIKRAEEIFGQQGELFAETGCAHCCTMMAEDKIVCSYEDIGRHNALDKVIGRALKQKTDFSQAVIFTTGRISGDYLRKIIGAGIPWVVSRSAVTGEAVKLARENKIHLLGFVRDGKGNIYN